MRTPDLFDSPTGRELRDCAISQAQNHADRVHLDWAIQATRLLHLLLLQRSTFQTEEFRRWAESHGLPAPPDARAYGGIILRAVKEGRITKGGYAPVTDPKCHCRPAMCWITVDNCASQQSTPS